MQQNQEKRSCHLPPTEKAGTLCLLITGVVEMLPTTFYREYLAALMTFPSPLLLRLIFLLAPYFLIPRSMHVPYSPLPYLDIGILFLYRKKTKQNKEIWSFFLMFLPLIGFAIWGFGKTIYKMDFPAESYSP